MTTKLPSTALRLQIVVQFKLWDNAKGLEQKRYEVGENYEDDTETFSFLERAEKGEI